MGRERQAGQMQRAAGGHAVAMNPVRIDTMPADAICHCCLLLAFFLWCSKGSL